MLFLDFFSTLRERGIKVTTHEWLALMQALASGVVGPNLTSFYWTSRALLVKREADFDRFDEAFMQVFHGVEAPPLVLDEALKWLEDAKSRPHLSPEELAALEALDIEKLRELLEERLKEQKERHDGGNRWIGTGGKSPFGHGGVHPTGVRIGGAGGGGRAMQIAVKREFQNYRDDLILDIRQTQLALRKLRRLIRRGNDLELDIDETVDRTGKNAGDLEIVMRPPRKNQIKLVLLMDAGGSMSPYARLVSTLFTAASKSTHWKSFKGYYFHNAIYEKIWTDIRLRSDKATPDVIAEAAEDSVLICVGDATMHPGELSERWGSIDYWHRNETPGIEWFWRLRRAYPHSVWLNPLPEKWWNAPTCQLIGQVFPMHPLTLSGLDAAIKDIRRRA